MILKQDDNSADIQNDATPHFASSSKIRAIYEKVKHELSSIYIKRKRTNFFRKLVWALFGLAIISSILFIFTASGEGSVDFENQDEVAAYYNGRAVLMRYFQIGIVVIILFVGLMSRHFLKLFTNLYTIERKTLKNMVTDLFPNFKFDQKNSVSLSEVKKSNLFSDVSNSTPIGTYGILKAEYQSVAMEMADIGIIDENAKNKIISKLERIPYLQIVVSLYKYVLKNIFTNKSSDNLYYTYRGLFCWTEFNKKLKGKTIIVPNNIESKLDKFSQVQFGDLEKVELEDPRFTSQFMVYGTNQIEPRYILTAAVMERIMAFKEKFDTPIMLSFVDNTLFFAIENSEGVFSFPSGKLEAVEILEELVEKVKTTLSIVDDLKLNNSYGQ